MNCPKCNNKIEENMNYCSNCGCKIDKEVDLKSVTKINTPLFVLFTIITFGIYYYVKMYRMTGDLRKIVPREQTVSPVVITSSLLFDFWGNNLSNLMFKLLTNENYEIVLILLCLILFYFVISTLLYCHIVYHTLKNLVYIAKINNHKNFKYNKLWAFLFGFTYINFIFNTYNERLIEKK